MLKVGPVHSLRGTLPSKKIGTTMTVISTSPIFSISLLAIHFTIVLDTASAAPSLPLRPSSSSFRPYHSSVVSASRELPFPKRADPFGVRLARASQASRPTGCAHAVLIHGCLRRSSVGNRHRTRRHYIQPHAHHTQFRRHLLPRHHGRARACRASGQA